MLKHLYFCSSTEDGGIYHCTFDGEKLTYVNKTPLFKPMYSVIKENRLYIITNGLHAKTNIGNMFCFNIDESGNLINKTEGSTTYGYCPCHLTNAFNSVFAVNYLSGSLIKFPNNIITNKGNGINPFRQDGSHPHFVCETPDKKYILCADLGLDTIFTYTENLTLISSAKVPAGYGCRHLAFSENGKYCYCANELANNVSVFAYNDGVLTYLNSYDCIPEYPYESAAAAIRVSNNNVYVSNRGANTVTRFKIEKDALVLKENTECLGDSPRDFVIDGGFAFVTNEKSGNVTVFKIKNGGLKPTDISLDIPSALCVNVL